VLLRQSGIWYSDATRTSSVTGTRVSFEEKDGCWEIMLLPPGRH